jgi:hypothetical protein
LPVLSFEKSKQELFEMEHKWLEYEYKLDTASIAKFLDDDFISIAADGNTNKKDELRSVYEVISNMKKNGVSIDSFRIEEPFTVKLFDQTAITAFTSHSYKTNNGKHEERRTKFYDVWRNINGGWKAMSSQAITVEEIK